MMHMPDESYNFFMKADLKPYIGEWIAIVGNSIVSHGKSAKEVFEAVKKMNPKSRPLLAKVPGKQAMIL